MRLGVRTAFREGLARTSHHEFSAFLGKSRQPAKKAFLRSFGVRQLAAAFSPASLLAATILFPPTGRALGRFRTREQARG